MKKGLVLEGGAMRGLFTAGVTDVMMENGIEFDGIIGVSAGAAFGCNYKSKQIGRAVRYNLKYCNDPRYCSFRSLIKTGDLYGADFCYHEMPEKLDIFDVETFENNPTEFYVVCTNAETGKAEYKKLGKVDYDCLEWIRASASLPLVSRVVEVEGKRLMDGGMADSIPLRYFEEIGYDRNVVILTQPRGYVKGKNKMMPIIRRTLKKYPNLIKAIETRHEMYNEAVKYICEKEERGEIFVIRPEEALNIGKTEHNRDRIQAVYDMGRKTAQENIERLKQFLNK